MTPLICQVCKTVVMDPDMLRGGLCATCGGASTSRATIFFQYMGIQGGTKAAGYPYSVTRIDAGQNRFFDIPSIRAEEFVGRPATSDDVAALAELHRQVLQDAAENDRRRSTPESRAACSECGSAIVGDPNVRQMCGSCHDRLRRVIAGDRERMYEDPRYGDPRKTRERNELTARICHEVVRVDGVDAAMIVTMYEDRRVDQRGRRVESRYTVDSLHVQLASDFAHGEMLNVTMTHLGEFLRGAPLRLVIVQSWGLLYHPAATLSPRVADRMREESKFMPDFRREAKS